MSTGYRGIAAALMLAGILGCGKPDRATAPVVSQQPAGKSEAASKLTVENYLKITEGMPFGDVELILGKPTDIQGFGFNDRNEQTVHQTWKQDNKKVFIVFEGGKVKSKTQSGLN